MRKRFERSRWIYGFSVWLVGLARARDSHAETLEQLVSLSEFVGIVRCSTVGQISAHFEVIESWKGGAVGETISIGCDDSDSFRESPPLFLVGEEYVVTAWRQGTNTSVLRHRRGGCLSNAPFGNVHPHAWGCPPSDFLVRSNVGVQPRNPESSEFGFEQLSTSLTDLAELRRRVLPTSR